MSQYYKPPLFASGAPLPQPVDDDEPVAITPQGDEEPNYDDDEQPGSATPQPAD